MSVSNPMIDSGLTVTRVGIVGAIASSGPVTFTRAGGDHSMDAAPTAKTPHHHAPSMRRSRDASRRRVVCPACGRRIARDDAREYDKHGDRWDRTEKSFEYLCRPCHDALTHQGRDELEALLCEVGAGEVDRDRFLRRYAQAVERRYGHAGEPDDTHSK